ncbi:MAG: serpin family protein [Candidatus Diapherotrites archaeon]|nr:serpin family protein [Candidatus Diapherotrites archaeon]
MKQFFIIGTLLVLLIAGCTTPIQVPGNNDEPEPVITEKPVLDDSQATIEGVNQIVQGNSQFGFNLYSKLPQDSSNVFFSPYSISTAIAMAYEGAQEQTAQEIQTVFGFPVDNSVLRSANASIYNKYNKKDLNYILSTANALWVQQDYTLLDNYKNVAQNSYGGKASNVDFVNQTEQTRQTINSWVENETYGKIKNLFGPGSLTPDYRLVITNAIYFKGKWKEKFNEESTENQDFTLANGSKVQVPMMRQFNEDFRYAETNEWKALEMDYEGNDLSMLILLPKENNLTELEQNLTLESVKNLKEQMSYETTNVFFPRFKFNTKYSLNDSLGQLGMPTAFSNAANFSGITGSQDLKIGIVIHQAFVEVNEKGTEAAAATGIGFELTSAPFEPEEPKEFKADHPFIFVIQDTETGNILFMGKVNNPLN